MAVAMEDGGSVLLGCPPLYSQLRGATAVPESAHPTEAMRSGPLQQPLCWDAGDMQHGGRSAESLLAIVNFRSVKYVMVNWAASKLLC